MGKRIPRYFTAEELDVYVCEACEPTLIGILTMSEHKVREPFGHPCSFCGDDLAKPRSETRRNSS